MGEIEREPFSHMVENNVENVLLNETATTYLLAVMTINKLLSVTAGKEVLEMLQQY